MRVYRKGSKYLVLIKPLQSSKNASLFSEYLASKIKIDNKINKIPNVNFINC